MKKFEVYSEPAGFRFVHDKAVTGEEADKISEILLKHYGTYSWKREVFEDGTFGEPIGLLKTDDQLINDIVAEMKEKGIDPGEVSKTMHIVREVFFGRAFLPKNLISKIMRQFPEFADVA